MQPNTRRRDAGGSGRSSAKPGRLRVREGYLQTYAQSPTEERRKAAEATGRKDAFGNLASAPYHAAFDDWDTQFSAEPSPGRVSLKLQMKKSIGNAAALITGEGYLADFKFDGLKDAAAKADKYFDVLATRAFGAEAVAKLKASPMSQVTAGKIVDAAMGSNAAAYIEFIASTGVSHSGSAVIVACTRTDVHLKADVGASANGFGQSIGNAQKTIFTKDYTGVVPSENQLCKSL